MSLRLGQRKFESERGGHDCGLRRVFPSFIAAEGGRRSDFRFQSGTDTFKLNNGSLRAASASTVIGEEGKISGTTGRQTHRHHQQHESAPY